MPPRRAIAYLRPLGVDDEPHLRVGEDRRFDVVAVVRDESGERRARLTDVLHRLASGEAGTLLAPRLRSVASSLRDLVALVDWLEATGVDLVALDVDWDTGTASGRRLAATLREIAGWRREPAPGRRGPGRPGIAEQAPELLDRVSGLRDRGLSLQAIADTLNADGVPTPRGGAKWRPSSVQAVLGYRRPHPPVRGFPAPPPPPGGPGAHRLRSGANAVGPQRSKRPRPRP